MHYSCVSVLMRKFSLSGKQVDSKNAFGTLDEVSNYYSLSPGDKRPNKRQPTITNKQVRSLIRKIRLKNNKNKKKKTGQRCHDRVRLKIWKLCVRLCGKINIDGYLFYFSVIFLNRTFPIRRDWLGSSSPCDRKWTICSPIYSVEEFIQ
jgi:hypothetical protein